MDRWCPLEFKVLAVLGVVYALASCATTSPAKPLPAPVITTVCPPLKTYTAAEQHALADALEQLNPANPLIGAMADYGQLRSAVRACKG